MDSVLRSVGFCCEIRWGFHRHFKFIQNVVVRCRRIGIHANGSSVTFHLTISMSRLDRGFKLEDYEVQELTEAFHVFDVTKRGLIPFEQAKILGMALSFCRPNAILVQTYGYNVSRPEFTDFDGSSHSNLVSLGSFLHLSKENWEIADTQRTHSKNSVKKV